MFLGMSAVFVCGTHERDLTHELWAQGQTRQVDMRQSSSTRKCRCVESCLSRRTRHLVRVCQIQHTMELIKPILTGAVRSFAVREEASLNYNSWIQKRLDGTVWNFCNSYYRRESAKGKIFATFPGPVSLFWWLARRPRYSDYEVVWGERWQRGERQREGIWRALKLIGIMIVVAECVWEGLVKRMWYG